jgi:hypothetical protein
MPKPDDDRPQPEPLPVRPPTLPPDFPDIPQNPSSELQPPPDPSATAMVTISITDEAYAGIRSMLPKGVRTATPRGRRRFQDHARSPCARPPGGTTRAGGEQQRCHRSPDEQRRAALTLTVVAARTPQLDLQALRTC